MDGDVIFTSVKFSPNNCPYLISIEPTKFVLGTNAQQYNIHLMMKMKVTLTDEEGHRRSSKVTKMK